MRPDYYFVLGVPRSASTAAIKLAYRQLALKHHPDVSEDQAAAEQKLREINEAYNVLSDRQKRTNYDRFGHAAAAVGGTESIGRIFDMFFGPTRGNAGRSRGEDLRCDVEATADEFAGGTEREISFRNFAICKACEGSGATPGTPVSTCDRCTGSGTMRHVRQTVRSVHLTQTTCTLCGGEGQIIVVPCGVCRGRGNVEAEKTLRVTIPAGSDGETPIRIEGGGGAGKRGGPDGDLYVHVAIKGRRAIRPAPPIPPGRRGTASGAGKPAAAGQTAARASGDIGQPPQASRRGTSLPFSMRWSWIAAIALLATMPSAAIFFAVHRSAAYESLAGTAVDICALPSMERFAADLVLGYATQIVKPPKRSFVTGGKDDTCDIRLSSVPGKPETAVARDAVVAIVNPLNPITRISEPQLRAVFSGTIHDWSKLGGPPGVIVPFLPDAASDEARAIEATLFAGLSIDRSVIRRPSSADVTRAVSGADRVSRDAIGLVTFSQAIAAKMIPLTYLPPPNVLTIASRRYPLTLTLTLQSESKRDPAATQQLIDFARSRDGLAIVEKYGFVPPTGL